MVSVYFMTKPFAQGRLAGLGYQTPSVSPNTHVEAQPKLKLALNTGGNPKTPPLPPHPTHPQPHPTPTHPQPHPTPTPPQGSWADAWRGAAQSGRGLGRLIMQPDRRVVWTLFVSQRHPLVLDFTFNQQSVSLSSRFAFGPVLFQVFQVFEVMVHVDNGTWCATDRL